LILVGQPDDLSQHRSGGGHTFRIWHRMRGFDDFGLPAWSGIAAPRNDET
jgi:hypothetical protein